MINPLTAKLTLNEITTWEIIACCIIPSIYDKLCLRSVALQTIGNFLLFKKK